YFRSFISFFLIRLPVYYYFGKTASKANALTDERNKYKYADITTGQISNYLIICQHRLTERITA
ncbi:MAG: hypothetical protein EGR80_00040, partial [Ruminiclostridium sp.]|nr:hypothetical protein [Ruminiclostridium sp.]